MAFIGNLLTDGVNYVTSINTEVEREVRQETEADSNDMLRLHLNLTKSLYENKEKTYGKSSFMVVLIITLVSTYMEMILTLFQLYCELSSDFLRYNVSLLCFPRFHSYIGLFLTVSSGYLGAANDIILLWH